jgi:hypothetical protein
MSIVWLRITHPDATIVFGGGSGTEQFNFWVECRIEEKVNQ